MTTQRQALEEGSRQAVTTVYRLARALRNLAVLALVLNLLPLLYTLFRLIGFSALGAGAALVVLVWTALLILLTLEKRHPLRPPWTRHRQARDVASEPLVSQLAKAITDWVAPDNLALIPDEVARHFAQGANASSRPLPSPSRALAVITAVATRARGPSESPPANRQRALSAVQAVLVATQIAWFLLHRVQFYSQRGSLDLVTLSLLQQARVAAFAHNRARDAGLRERESAEVAKAVVALLP